MTERENGEGSGRRRGPARKILLALAVLVVLGGAIALALTLIYRERLEDYIGRQVVGIANSYLVPDIDFLTISYAPPYSVTLTDVTLTAPDRTEVLRMGTLRIELAEVPRVGRPIRIASLIADDSVLRLIQDFDDEGNRSGFRGLLPIVEARPGTEEELEKVDEAFRLSNVLQLREVRLERLDVAYEPGGGQPTMLLPGLTLALDIEPVEIGDEAGWYKLDTSSEIGPTGHVKALGAVNLDTFAVKLDNAEIGVDVTEETISSLPPQVQTVLNEYNARGRLDIQASADIEALAWSQGEAMVNLKLDGFSLFVGDLRALIDTAELDLKMHDRMIELETFSLSSADGLLKMTGWAMLEDSNIPAHADWTIEALSIGRLLREGSETRSKLGGIVSGEGAVGAELVRWKESMSGNGEIRVRDGRLLMLPGLTQLADATGISSDRITGDATGNHRLDAEFTVIPGAIRIDSSTVVTNFLAARTTGTISIVDLEMDLTANAGPLERAQELLGPIGDLFGGLTDRLVRYRIRGPVNDPSVSVAPLGIDE